MFNTVHPIVKTTLITIIYIILFLLPSRLSIYLTDDVFNYALCIITFTLIALGHNYNLMSAEFKKLKMRDIMTQMFLVITGIIFIMYYLLNRFTVLDFSFLLVPEFGESILLRIMKIASITVCLHINEAYIFARFGNLFNPDTRAAKIFPACMFFILMMILSYFSSYHMISAFLYYGGISALLAIIRNEKESIMCYIYAASAVMLFITVFF